MEQDYSFLKILLNEDIYVIDEEKSSPERDNSIQYYGENKNNITVIVDESNPDFMRSSSFQFLNKVMEAVKLSQHEYALVNLSENKGLSLEEIKTELTPNHLIVFGDIGLVTSGKYELTTIDDINSLKADTLTEVQEDVEKKKALWKALQEMFK